MGRRLAGYETEKGNIGVLLIIYKFHFYSVGIFFMSWCHLSLVQFFFSPQLILWKYHYRLIQRLLLTSQVILWLIKLKVLSHHSKYIFHIMLHLSYFTLVAEFQLFMGETVLLANIFLLFVLSLFACVYLCMYTQVCMCYCVHEGDREQLAGVSLPSIMWILGNEFKISLLDESTFTISLYPFYY